MTCPGGTPCAPPSPLLRSPADRLDSRKTVIARLPWTNNEIARLPFARPCKPSHFIVIGLIFTVAFVLVILGVVKLVTHLAGV